MTRGRYDRVWIGQHESHHFTDFSQIVHIFVPTPIVCLARANDLTMYAIVW